VDTVNVPNRGVTTSGSASRRFRRVHIFFDPSGDGLCVPETQASIWISITLLK